MGFEVEAKLCLLTKLQKNAFVARYFHALKRHRRPVSLSRLERRANNANVVGSTPTLAIFQKNLHRQCCLLV